MGWTLIEGDVFRPPQNVTLLSVLVSNGIQLSLTAFVTLGIFVYFRFWIVMSGDFTKLCELISSGI